MCRCADENEEAVYQLERQWERSEARLIDENRELRAELEARTFEVEELRQLAASREAKIIFYRAALTKIYEAIRAILAAPRHPNVIAAKEKS